MAKQKNNEETKETMWGETQLCKTLHIWPIKKGINPIPQVKSY